VLKLAVVVLLSDKSGYLMRPAGFSCYAKYELRAKGEDITQEKPN
jgi:hypothetical protein